MLLQVKFDICNHINQGTSTKNTIRGQSNCIEGREFGWHDPDMGFYPKHSLSFVELVRGNIGNRARNKFQCQ